MPVIEFNVKAKPKLAEAFGGVLETGKYYLLRNGEIITPTGEETATGWKFCMFVTGPLMGTPKWWLPNGLFQGQEFHTGYKWHVTKETTKPPEEKFPGGLKIGASYIIKGGLKTTPLELYMVHNNDVGGPVFCARVVKADGQLSMRFFYNMDGVYLGTASLQWPNGNKDSARCLEKLA